MGTIDLCLTEAEEKSIASGKRHVFKSVPRARAGDTFLANGERFEIIDVCERTAGTCIERYYPLEGCQSPEELARDWAARNGGDWDPGRLIYVHWFRELDGKG